MWEKTEKNNIIYYTIPEWASLGAEVYISCRLGGVSKKGYDSLNLARHVEDEDEAVTENRRLFMAALDIPMTDFVSIQQVHGKKIRHITPKDRGTGLMSYNHAFPETDGMYTAHKGLFLSTFYADCLPIAIFDPEHKVLGTAHAGWRGTLQNIGASLLREMNVNYGTEPKDALVAFGPGIGVCCYEVDKVFYSRFTTTFNNAESWFKRGKAREYFFDNAKANRDLLTALGVRDENITDLNMCTCCNQELFYSYRGSDGRCGRHGLFARLI
ncbi:MAG: peptidoglycan editing factor PgeF [Clostridiales bacterium]